MLTDAQVEQFVEDGYLRLPSAIAPPLARRCRERAAEQLGIDLTAPGRWTRPVVRGLVGGEVLGEAANAAGLVAAIGQLVNPDPWYPRPDLGSFVVRFPTALDPGDTGWHIDSSFQHADDERWFVNYRSRARALLLLCLLSDVGADDAPSKLLPGSHLELPRLLYPAGVRGLAGPSPGQRSEVPLPDTSGEPVLATGDAGDVLLCHPFLVHAASWPHRGTSPRFVAQPPIALVDSLRLDGGLAELSPVARAVRLGLGR